MTDTFVKSDAEWREILTPEQYRVTRRGGTERAFSGAYCHTYTAGVYRCICCALPLFRSSEKYDSGTGWPSFWAPVFAANIRTVKGNTYLVRQIVVRCARCGAHLGHVFYDGPAPTHRRYCINSVALRLEAVAETAAGAAAATPVEVSVASSPAEPDERVEAGAAPDDEAAMPALAREGDAPANLTR